MRPALANSLRSAGTALSPITSAYRAMMARRVVRLVLISVLILLLLVYPEIDTQTRVSVASLTEVYVLLALGLNIVVGYAGLLDLGYAAFFAIGAYTMAMLGSPFFAPGHSVALPLLHFGPAGVHVNFWILIPIAAVVAALCGALFGAPTLRLRGDYLAIVTLGFGEIVPLTIRNLGPDNSFGLPNLTNGVNRITGVDVPPDFSIGGFHITFATNDSRPWYYLGLIIIIFSVVVIYSLRSSKLGRAWAAIREDEVAAAHMGINIRNTRLLAFGLGAAFSGFGGLLYASQVGSVEAASFSFSISVTILVMVILGGIGSIPGVMVGAIIIEYLNLLWLDDIAGFLHSIGGHLHSSPGPLGSLGVWLSQVDLDTARPLLYGAVLLIVMLLRPQGLIPSSTRARELRPATADISDEENEDLYTIRTEGHAG